jgi:hypothetical protein
MSKIKKILRKCNTVPVQTLLYKWRIQTRRPMFYMMDGWLLGRLHMNTAYFHLVSITADNTTAKYLTIIL